MADEDRAQDVELREWEANNRSRGAQVRFAPGEPGYGPEFCQVKTCEVDMPEQRRAWGFRVCVDCQQRAEDRARRMS